VQNIHVSSRTQTCTQQVVVQQDSTSLLCERKQLMEKETIYSDAEMVGLPQSGGGRRQRMAAGGDTDLSQEDRNTECSAASSVISRPDERLRALENNRPDASAASSQGTSRRTAGNRSQDGNKAALGRSREGNTVATDRLCGGKVAADRLRGGKSIFAVRRGREMAEGSEPDGSGEDCRNGGAAAETAADWSDGRDCGEGEPEAVVEAAYSGWWLEAVLQWLWLEAALQWLWLEAVVTSGCGGRQWWQVAVVGDSAKRRLCGDQLCVWVSGSLL
jgi:hypothetical protein